MLEVKDLRDLNDFDDTRCKICKRQMLRFGVGCVRGVAQVGVRFGRELEGLAPRRARGRHLLRHLPCNSVRKYMKSA